MSAVAAVIEGKWVDKLEKQMEEARTEVITKKSGADVAAQLEIGREAACTALGT